MDDRVPLEVPDPKEGADVLDTPRTTGMLEDIRRFWDDDAPTYDNAKTHRPTSRAVVAAWTAALSRLLPPAPARVLDAGAGTGFLSIIAARLGHRVTALDLSPKMLERLEDASRSEQLDIDTVEGSAMAPPSGFDAVIERHLLWTLPDPALALTAWREASAHGRLVLLESMWGAVDPFEALRGRLRRGIRNLRGDPPEHHGSYSEELRSALPLGSGTPPEELVEMVEAAGWRRLRLERLRDVEWAERSGLPPVERLIGVGPRFAISAD